ncbi:MULTISPECIES: DUF1947 domain-containing protein [Acidiplasma]|jgi:PUA domain protein|uniref:PUA domain-containing protein n=4 Tax=Acidiplasma TaxID=507753 RepID=A0A0Q0RF28_9ARCH|nr:MULTISPECIES: DUF1947 domain-containing protein [Acidiplasma]KQB33691.1 hypothetical protein AOG55_02300 [Acidiplasma cupricumulans]KQB36533.1 hypothetical protein AOG54_02120 [Acidiplasma aeolicum]WMT54184.1 MAG: DUF1947 domain-containing protein [Acidiplasma sp.]
MSKHVISKKDYKELRDKMAAKGMDISGLENIEVEEKKKDKIYYYMGRPVIVNDMPTIYLINYIKPKDRVVVIDSGAEPHINNGSNLFAPGIIDMDINIKKGDTVYIKSSKGYYIALGIAMDDGENIMRNKKGEAVKIIHYMNDQIMKLF